MGCNNILRLGSGNFDENGARWDGHKYVCGDDFNDQGEHPCLVYTFGVGKESSFEEAMAAGGKIEIENDDQGLNYFQIVQVVRYMHMTTP